HQSSPVVPTPPHPPSFPPHSSSPRAPRPPPSTLFPYTTLFRSAYRPRAVESPVPAPQVLQLRRRVDPVSGELVPLPEPADEAQRDRKSTRLNSSHVSISYAVFCLKKKSEGRGETPHGSGRQSAR